MEIEKYPQFISDLSDYLNAIKSYSEVYIKNLIVTVRQFLEFINVYRLDSEYTTIENISLNDIRLINNSDIYSFIYFLAENHYKQSSRIIKIEHLRTFFDYLYRIKHNIFKEPLKKIQREKKIDIKLPNYLSLKEAEQLVEIYSNSSDINDIRDNAILRIFLNCGLRISEVANLKITDIDLKNDKFTIIGKGDKERVAYINASTKEALLKYLEIRKNIETKLKRDKNILFLSQKRLKMDVKTIRRLIKKAYELVGIDSKCYSAHTLRHTCATLLYKAGVDIKIIQEILGHVEIDTTEIYTHLHNEKVMKAMQNHPLAHFMMKDAVALAA